MQLLIARIAVVFLLSTAAFAADDLTLEYCNELSSTAAMLMNARHDGLPASRLVEASGRNKDMVWLITQAYQAPSDVSPEAFADSVYVRCLKYGFSTTSDQLD